MAYIGLYVDVENLTDIAKETITALFEQWPGEVPRPNMLRLYVRADQVELWQFWANERGLAPDIQVTGVQHYALTGSKNSADLALALDAITDLLKGKTTYTAVLSDDSDFTTLFIKIKKEFSELDGGKLPFIWFQTDRSDTKSTILDGFLPSNYVRTVVCSEKKHITNRKKNRKTDPTVERAEPQDITHIAQTIIQNIPLGQFKNADCVKIIKKHFPNHPLTKLNSASFGNQFIETIWPTLEQYGVRLNNPGKKPRRYEMTDEAKHKAGMTS